ncbi:hypothetical protein, partial [Pandoraea sp. E26]|uniref:hypothetical protein n=1 Tax=Pandoraea sp. E26 TaxID=1427365 RepID=UPI00048F67D0
MAVPEKTIEIRDDVADAGPDQSHAAGRTRWQTLDDTASEVSPGIAGMAGIAEMTSDAAVGGGGV